MAKSNAREDTMRSYNIWASAAGLLAAATTGAHADILSDVRSDGTLICGVLGVNEPFAYQDVQTRELVGYEIDLCHLLADHLGVQGETKVVTSQSRSPELVQERV